MRIVIQRVSRADMDVVDEEGNPDAGFAPVRMGQGMVILVGISDADGPGQVAYATRKLSGMRIFEDGEGKMNLSVLQVGGGIMSVPQFTLYAGLKHGNRPNFLAAGRPDHAKRIWEDLNRALEDEGIPVVTGSFGDHMRVELTNDGPVTILMDTDELMD